MRYYRFLLLALAGGLLAAPAARAQGLGGLLNQARAKATQAASRPLPSAKSFPAATTPALPTQDVNFLQVEARLIATLRQAAPAGTRLFMVNCQPTATGFSYHNAYLTGPATEPMVAGSLPDLPASAKADFATLRPVMMHEHNGAVWEACKLTLTFGPLRPYDDLGSSRVDYDYPQERDFNEAPYGYEVPSPAGLLAEYRQKSAPYVAARQGAAAQQAKENQRVQQAQQAAAARAGHGAVAWHCTHCTHTTRWPEKPGGFDTGACPATPDESGPHQWAR